MKINPIGTGIVYPTIRQSNILKINQSYTNTADSFKKDTTYNNVNPISFLGITSKGIVKQRGLMFHITGLPAERSFCGQFGDKQTLAFIKWLKAAKQTHWIMNPLNALQEDLCPYNGGGRFSRNKYIVNLNKLIGKDYGKILKPSELPDDISVPVFTLEMLEKQKAPRFKIAFERFKNLSSDMPIRKEYDEFVAKNDRLWLDYYASYDVISKIHGNNWLLWRESLLRAPEIAKEQSKVLSDIVAQDIEKDGISKDKCIDNINLYKFEQFLYDKQFREFVNDLDNNGIKLIMDLPIGISPTGADVWGKKSIFLLDKSFKPEKVSGCPPEGNYPYTQVWGHALYNYDSPEFWEYQEASLKELINFSDLRLDHFVGYINRAEIPTKYTKPDGTVLEGNDIFKPVKDGGMGEDFFLPDWIVNIYDKHSPNGENVFELFMRVAKEVGKNPENTYILENFGPLAETKIYRSFDKKYGKNFISQRVPIGMGLKETDKVPNINSPFNITDSNIAILTGNHDLPSLKQILDDIIDGKNPKLSKNLRLKQLHDFETFCKEELKLNDEELADKSAIFENAMKWHYIQNVKQVQTTLQDALGLYFRPNIPGFWNGMEDKFLMKPTAEALMPYWSRVFPKDFLIRDNKMGINPGYKEAADKFVNMMKELFS